MKTPELDINGRPFSMDLSPWATGDFVSELEHIQEGRFALPGSAILRAPDRYFVCGMGNGSYWTDTLRTGKLVNTERYVYTRAITDDPELYKKMQDYAKGLSPNASAPANAEPAKPSLEEELAAARAKVAELEKKVKENELKDGDWAVVVDSAHSLPPNGSLVQITNIRSEHGETFCNVVDNDRTLFLYRFRKATPEEVAAHLEKQKIVEVTVDGTVYKGEYCPGYVKFGCAKIDNHFIVALDNWMTSKPALGNRKIEAVQIGKGLFTAAMIEKLAKNLKDAS